MKSILFSTLVAVAIIGCATDHVKHGRDLFNGGEVDVKASQAVGQIVLKPGSEFVPFDGNGRSCGSCHRARDNFGMSKATRDNLPLDDPFFYPGIDEDQALLAAHGLVFVLAGEIKEFRPTPALDDLCDTCDKYGTCNPLGLNSQRVSSLHAFTIGAVINHHPITVERIPGQDFVLPSQHEIDDLVEYMLSSNVCEGL